MKYNMHLWILAILLFFSSCEVLDCERGNRSLVRQELQIGTFDGIELAISANVTIQQGEDFLVEVEGESNIIDLVDRDVRRGVWRIHFDRCVRTHDRLHFFITMPDLQELSVSGSGRIFSENIFLVDDVQLTVSGSGEIDLGIEGRRVDAAISGSGQIYLEGEVEILDFSVSGSGDLRAFDMVSNRADIRISGSGDAEVFVNDFLEVVISGSGDVLYKGSPELDVKVSGSGRVIDAN